MSNKEKILKLQKFLSENNCFYSDHYHNLVFEKGEMFVVEYEKTFHENPYLVAASDDDFDDNLRLRLEGDYTRCFMSIEANNKRKQIIKDFYKN